MRAVCVASSVSKIPYDVYYKELSNVYTFLKVVTYVTYCHTNNKMNLHQK